MLIWASQLPQSLALKFYFVKSLLHWALSICKRTKVSDMCNCCLGLRRHRHSLGLPDWWGCWGWSILTCVIHGVRLLISASRWGLPLHPPVLVTISALALDARFANQVPKLDATMPVRTKQIHYARCSHAIYLFSSPASWLGPKWKKFWSVWVWGEKVELQLCILLCTYGDDFGPFPVLLL